MLDGSLDHWGVTTYGGRDWFVSEPYGLDRDALDAITALCDRLDLDVTAHGVSWHYPSATLRLMFWPKGAEPMLPFMQHPDL